MKKYSVYLLVILLLSACADKKFDVDVSNININLNIKRLDKDLFDFNKENAADKIAFLSEKYGEFYDVYNYKILNIGSSGDKLYPEKLSDFIQYCKDEHITDTVWTKFDDLTAVEADLTEAFKHHKYYFPEKKLPEIITFISAFNESVVSVENQTGIAPDKYLGENCEFYERLGIEKYLRRRMIPQAIAPDVMRSLAMSEYPYESSSDALIDNMIYEGKIQYYLNCMLPETPDTIKWRYTERQYNWANIHEEKIWNYLVENKKLFESNRLQTRQYVGEGPFTNPFTDVSAPRAGVFIGYKIVEAYMDKNPDVSLKDLMQNKDYQAILTKSKYNPD